MSIHEPPHSVAESVPEVFTSGLIQAPERVLCVDTRISMIVNSRSEATSATSRFLLTSATVTWLPGISGVGVSIIHSLPRWHSAEMPRWERPVPNPVRQRLDRTRLAAGSPHNGQS